jgi:iron(III) transport system ATP-binding protein
MYTLLNIDNIECQYRSINVVRNLSFDVTRGSIVGLLGPSGCGKTTVLRAIAGFEPVIQGEIQLRGKIVSRPGYTLAPEKRKLGMVFQDYALFPHLNITDNICFGLRKLSTRLKQQTAEQLLELVGMGGMGKRYPHELSGGQQQRVALARALAPEPEIILMDEPFSNLDVELRERLSTEVRDILKQRGITGIIVTHDQHEAFAIADTIGVMKHGRILQWDTPYNLYHEPCDRFVADFIGQGSFLKATVLSPNSLETELGILNSEHTLLWPKGTLVDVLMRPDDIVPDPNGSITAVVNQKAFKGAEILYTLQLPTGGMLLSLFPSHHNHEIGEKVCVNIEADHVVAFPTD